ncbi:GNAT family N-acetyltransferase [Frankia sp. Cppng1_Ct_nod]|uniref:GNAT family N-acetyltransferase n=1 Tax=Frankia sp. Cppng1_Ct_nod TaxID=2897162 RepID=UPI0020243111|nr:GNAT family N-acetyltransferase [Frankia sp. Cppng1_Ct_nod]
MSTDFPPGLTLRHPQAADHPRVLAVMDDWWAGFQGRAGSLRRASLLPRLFFQHFTTSGYIVENDNGRLMAFLVGFLSQTAPDEAYIHFVGVDPALRRHGVAAALYQRFFELAEENGRHTVRCITSPGNRTSLAFHTRMGFQIEPGDTLVDGVPVQRDYDGPGLDHIVFTKHLDRACVGEAGTIPASPPHDFIW